MPGPHADTANQHERAEQVRKEIENQKNCAMVETYLDQIIYYPEDIFKDRVHFDKEKLKNAFWDELARDLVP